MASRGWKKLSRFRGHEAAIGKFAFSPDGKSIATPSEDGRLIIWDVATGKPRVERSVGSVVSAVAWSPDGEKIAISIEDLAPIDYDVDFDYAPAEYEVVESRGGEDELLRTFEHSVTPLGGEPRPGYQESAMNIRVLDNDSGLQIGALESQSNASAPADIQWLEDGEHLVAASDRGVGLWVVSSGHFRGWFDRSAGRDYWTLLRISDREVCASGVNELDLVSWDPRTGAIDRRIPLSGGGISGAMDSTSSRIAIGTDTGLVQILHSISDESPSRTLEGHAGPVTGVDFSADGSVLATAAIDGVKLWSTSDWTLVSELPDAAERDSLPPRIAFSPQELVLAIRGPKDSELNLWGFDLPSLAAQQSRPNTVHYANAKVVLVGDTGVGKSGLGLVLAGKKFEPTDSTHQRQIWTLSSDDTAGSQPEHREVFLWDLAGQPGYRLLHQLHLADVAVALIVFDARDELDPLAGVRYWSRALDQASRIAESPEAQIARILVAARMDRGGAKVDDDELRTARKEFRLDRYVTTSAKEGEGVRELREQIDEAIDWSSIPKVSSTGLFEAIRRFLVAKRATNVVLTTESELRDAFSRTGVAPEQNVLDEFRVCVERLQSRGLLRRLSFGDLVLLRPEVLDAYAAAVINAAAASEDGLGAIREADVRSANFLIPSEDRLQESETEKLLLIATIEDLLKHEVALREDSGNGAYLVFPTQTKRHLDLDDNLRPWCSISLEGPIAHIWATLVVRLSHSGVFVRDDVGLNRAVFRGAGRSMAIRLDPTDEGAGRLQLLSERDLNGGDTERLFEGFVLGHLRRRAVADSLEISYVVTCLKCNFLMPDELIAMFHGQKTLRCPECAEKVALDKQATAEETTRAQAGIVRLERSADHERSRVAARTTVEGKVEVQQFDTFLAHNSKDRESVVAIAERLRDYGLNPWLDQDQIPPGRWFQDIIQEAIGNVGSAVVVLGESGLGRWQALELKAFVAACIERNIPVIPTLLPGAKLPAEVQPFLSQLQVVEFAKTIDEIRAFANLVWGITGDKADQERVLRGEMSVRL